MDDKGRSLIFLLSLPRSGSTLLQHVLAGHSAVGATAEPWILFPAILALRHRAVTGVYDAETGRIALSEFLSRLDGGEEAYYVALRRYALELYSRHLRQHRKEIFLDKTSRYYLVLPELFRVFPQARYVFLVRNPLAVISSYFETMVLGDLRRLGESGIRSDLLDGYRLMLAGLRFHGDDATVVKYEELVANPEQTVRRLCKDLHLDFEQGMLEYGKRGILSGKLVDPKSIHRHDSPVSSYVDAWRHAFRTKQHRHLGRAFLDHLGPGLVTSLGYSFEELKSTVSKQRGDWLRPIVSWNELLSPVEGRSGFQRWKLDMTLAIQRGEAKTCLRFLVRPARKLLRPTRRALKRVETAFTAIYEERSVRGDVSQPTGFCGARWETSSQYSKIDEDGPLDLDLQRGWRTAELAGRQLSAYKPLLQEMYKGKPRKDFETAATALRLTGLDSLSLLEIGCGNGYYSEILSWLTKKKIRYTGVDYSPSMIASGRRRYPHCDFIIGYANALPFTDNSFDIAWSGTIVMHLKEYMRAIRETRRIARRYCIFHSTPLLAFDRTFCLKKEAYGVPVVEVLINQSEFESILRESGMRIRHVLESLTYRPRGIGRDSIETLTYVCEKLPVAGTDPENS